MTKNPKTYSGKQKASSIKGAGLTGGLYVENENRPIFITLHIAQVQVDERPQPKPGILNLLKEKKKWERALNTSAHRKIS